jgi:hypothetical protein
MKILFLIMVWCSGVIAHGQSFDFGPGYRKFNVVDELGNYTLDASNLGIYAAFTIPVIPIQKTKAISLQASSSFFTDSFSDPGALYLDIPIYVLLNWGADATRKSSSRFGGALGGGYNIQRHSIEGLPFNDGSPSLLGEFHYVTKHDALYKLKLLVNLDRTTKRDLGMDPQQVLQGVVTSTSSASIFITYTLNY